MKKLLTLAFFLISFGISAQTSNAILFTENGEPFQVILNGILQNAKAETNVKMTQLVAPNYKCRIIFADTKLGYLDFNMMFPNGSEEITWNIKKNNKGAYVTRWVSSVPLDQAPPTPPTQSVVIYTATPAVPVTTTTTTVQHSQTTTTTNSNPMTGDDVNINMGINVGGEGGSISIHASGNDMGMNSGIDMSSSGSSTTTTTTHTTTTTTNSGGVAPVQAPAQVTYVSGYNGATNCPVPMNPADFGSFKESISSKSFENTKLTIAKQVLQNNCLTAQQVKETMGLFDFENTKLDFAKYAYAHTYDTGNYFKVNDAFEFESSVDELNRYIRH